MKRNKRGKIIVISGPSGVGKRTVWSPIINDPRFNLVFSVSMTTRPKRAGERLLFSYKITVRRKN